MRMNQHRNRRTGRWGWRDTDWGGGGGGGCWKKKKERVMESEALHQPDSEEEREEKEEEENAVRELSWKGGREGKTPRGEGGGVGGWLWVTFRETKCCGAVGGWRESVVIYGSLPPRVSGWRQAEPQVDTSPHSQPLQAHFDGRVHVNIVRYRRFIPTTPPLRILTGRGGPHRCGRVGGGHRLKSFWHKVSLRSRSSSGGPRSINPV